MMLPRKDLGRRKERRLRAGFDRGQHRQHCNQRLARADIALEQAKHRDILRHVAADLVGHALLRAGQPVRKLELAGQLAGAAKRNRALAPRRLAQQQERELIGENLVIGEAPARLLGAGLAVRLAKRRAPAAPALARSEARLDPFGQLGRALER